MEIIDGIPVFGVAESGALEQIKRCVLTAHKTALMADNHLGYGVPIGGVVAYKDAISPSGVGFDIACGNCAVLLDIPSANVRANLGTIMDDIWNTISFGVGRKNSETVDSSVFDLPNWNVESAAPLKELSRQQLGTVGSGNHYVDVLEDERGRIWIGVHFGSRGLGHKIGTWFLEAAGAKDGIDVEPCVLQVASDLGAQCLVAMELAGAYAYDGREWVCGRVAKLLDAEILKTVHNHHNYAWKETHGGEDLWVVRKGATPAWPGQMSFVGGSMGDISVIIRGVDSDLSKQALYSTVHGAGRVMGRMEAKGKVDKKTGEVKRAGKVTREMMDEWVTRKGVELRGAGVDESPHCYKRLPEVLEAHAGTIEIVHTLTPLGVAMASSKEFDPYKD